MKRLIVDIDGTLTTGRSSDYTLATPRQETISALRRYRAEGFEIVLYTARNMRTYESSVGKINAHMLPILFEWLSRHDIPYDEVWTGKPWCGNEGFYVDDKAVRPDEFANLSYDEIQDLIAPPNLSPPLPSIGE